MRELSARTAVFTDSVIRRMTRISARYGAVNLSQGFPDFDPPKALLGRLKQVAEEDYHQYSITWGAKNTREALARKQSALMGFEIDPEKESITMAYNFQTPYDEGETVYLLFGIPGKGSDVEWFVQEGTALEDGSVGATLEKEQWEKLLGLTFALAVVSQ